MKKFLISILLIILVFFSCANVVQANLFTDDDKKSEIEETINKDERWTFWKDYSKNDSEV